MYVHAKIYFLLIRSHTPGSQLYGNLVNVQHVSIWQDVGKPPNGQPQSELIGETEPISVRV